MQIQYCFKTFVFFFVAVFSKIFFGEIWQGLKNRKNKDILMTQKYDANGAASKGDACFPHCVLELLQVSCFVVLSKCCHATVTDLLLARW